MTTTTPTPRAAGGRRAGVAAGWPVPAGLIVLSLIPLAAGTLRLVQLAGGPALMPVDHRFTDAPVALVAHILGAATYAVAGAFQFVPAIRRNRPGWHRRAGRILTIAGLVVAGSALWITLTYDPQPGTGTVLFVLRAVLAAAMAAALITGFLAIRRRDVVAHRAWMTRAYALGLGAGSQVFTEGLGTTFFGAGEVRSDLAKASGWVINLAVAEWIIRRQPRPRGDLQVAPAVVGRQRHEPDRRNLTPVPHPGRRTPRRPLVLPARWAPAEQELRRHHHPHHRHPGPGTAPRDPHGGPRHRCCPAGSRNDRDDREHTGAVPGPHADR